MAVLPVTNYSYYPVSFLPTQTNTSSVTFNPEYINDLISLGVTDYFSPTQFVTNPLFAQVDNFNQNIGVLQTATNALDNILTLINDFNDINNPTQDALNTLSNEINSIINNTTYDNLNVFSQKITIGDNTLDLSIPTFDPNSMTLEDYTKLITEKYDSLNDALKTLSFTLPFNSTSYNPVDYNTFFSLYDTGTLFNAYNTEYITPENLQILLS